MTTSATSPKIASVTLTLRNVVVPCKSDGSAKEIRAPVRSSMTKIELAHTHQSRCSILCKLSAIAWSRAPSGGRFDRLCRLSMSGGVCATDVRSTLGWSNVVVKTIPVRSAAEVTWGLTSDTDQNWKGYGRSSPRTVEAGILVAFRPVPVRRYGGPIGNNRWCRQNGPAREDHDRRPHTCILGVSPGSVRHWPVENDLAHNGQSTTFRFVASRNGHRGRSHRPQRLWNTPWALRRAVSAPQKRHAVAERG